MKRINLVFLAVLAIPAVGCAHDYGHYGTHARYTVGYHSSYHGHHRGHSQYHHSGRSAVNERQHNQQDRLRAGIRDGNLTRGEAHRLRHDQRDIRREERFYRRDGHLSSWERAELQRELNSASRDIRRQRNDRQDRW